MLLKLLIKQPRRIARLVQFLAAVPGLAMAAESPAIRLSAPTIGWVLASDGLQMIEIAGIASSPRVGRSVALPSTARGSWSAPDGNSILLRLDTGLFLVRSNDLLEQLTAIPADLEVTAVWDRSSAGFATCWGEKCQTSTANGALREKWEVAGGSRALAFSMEAGLVTATAESAEWRRGGDLIPLGAVPAAATFRAGTEQLWVLDSAGQLAGRDRQGRRIGEGESIANAIGLVSSLDGKNFFAVNANREAAVYSVDSSKSERLAIEDSVEGVWAAPGIFAIRFHESAKRPIAIWNGETGITGWMPAATNEVRQ